MAVERVSSFGILLRRYRTEAGFTKPLGDFIMPPKFGPGRAAVACDIENLSGPGRRQLRIPQPPSPPGFCRRTGPTAQKKRHELLNRDSQGRLDRRPQFFSNSTQRHTRALLACAPLPIMPKACLRHDGRGICRARFMVGALLISGIRNSLGPLRRQRRERSRKNLGHG